MKAGFKPKKLKKNQIYFIIFDSGYREYFSMGRDLDVMAQNILNRYNRYCIPEHKIKTLEDLASISSSEDYHFNTYIVETDSASDMEYRDFDNEIYLGDYLESKK